jgi:uncharacterized protein (TIGR02922 family)
MPIDYPVTVLFYDDNNPLILSRKVFKHVEMGNSNRVLLPVDFRMGRTIIAVLEGDVTVLNCLGERAHELTLGKSA